jgi:hypothetical protein
MILLAGGCAAATPPPAGPASAVTVAFKAPERFADVKGSCFGPDDQTAPHLSELERYIRETGQRYVPAGGALAVTVTDIDLAGELEPPVRLAQRCEARVFRDIFPPRITLEFRLTDAEGRTVKSGPRALTDAWYLTRVDLPIGEPLRHEKRLLREWLRTEFPAPGGGTR